MKGEVQVFKVINDAEVRMLKNLHSGDFFGEMAIIHDAPRAATVVATSPVLVLEIQKDAFAAMLERSSSVSLAMVREVSRRLRENDELAIEDLSHKASELASAYQQLAEQEFARSEFLTVVAHELRTPLMAANGFLQVIRKGFLQGETLDSALDTVARNLQEITSLVNDILFLQEMDLILVDFQPADVGAILSKAVDQVRPLAEQNKVSLSLMINPGIPRVSCNIKSLERVFLAVLDNAIKFSPDGGEVRITINSKENYVIVEVQDHGVGIPPEALPHIFDRFFHVENVDGHLFRGLGLGLSITREVINQHKGRIVVQSELGKGSTFTISLLASK
jgi:signal transduction histidine kinase